MEEKNRSMGKDKSRIKVNGCDAPCEVSSRQKQRNLNDAREMEQILTWRPNCWGERFPGWRQESSKDKTDSDQEEKDKL